MSVMRGLHKVSFAKLSRNYEHLEFLGFDRVPYLKSCPRVDKRSEGPRD
jgi:hypothetical protein